MLKFLPRAHFQSFYRCFTELNVCSVHICLSPAGTLPNLLCEEPWTLSFFLFLMPSDCCSSGLTKWAWRQDGRLCSYSGFVLYSVFSWPHEAHPHWGGKSALLSLPIQMLLSFRNTLTDTPRIMFNQISGYPVVQPS